MTEPVPMLKRLRLLAGALFLLAGGLAQAQGWPTQPVKIIAPVPAGGGVDLLSRAIAQKLQEQWNQSVVVENKPGASAAIGTDFVAKSSDGHTLLMGYSVLATNKFLVSKLPYDLEKELTPIIHVGYIPLILVTQPNFPANSVKELIALLKANPGKYAYASGGAGAGAHLSGELFKHLTGVDLTHVPYKGNAPALNDVVAGHVSLMFVDPSASVQLVRQGKLRALGVTTARRVPMAPDIPPLAEAGLPGFDAASWHMIVAPAATPKLILSRLNAAIRGTVEDKQVSDEMNRRGFVPRTEGSPEELAAFVKSEIVRWGKVVQQAGAAGIE